MPIFIHPILRTLHQDMESEGLIKISNSPLYTLITAQEAAGTIKPPTFYITRVLRGTVYQHNQNYQN